MYKIYIQRERDYTHIFICIYTYTHILYVYMYIQSEEIYIYILCPCTSLAPQMAYSQAFVINIFQSSVLTAAFMNGCCTLCHAHHLKTTNLFPPKLEENAHLNV